jgi:NitT/TauT family transport system substrate-binding protein
MRRAEYCSAIAASSLMLLGLPRRGSSQTAPEKLHVAGTTTEDSTNVYYAVKNGLFRRAGLDVEMEQASSGAAATAAVIAGTYELAKTNLLSIFLAHLHDIPVVIGAPSLVFVSKSPIYLLQIARDATYKTGIDLNGKTIGVPAVGDLNTLVTRAWVDKNGGDWKSLKFVEVPTSALEAAVAEHRIDAAILGTPFLEHSLAAGSTKTLGDAYGAVAPTFLAGAYVARSDWASGHADTLRKFNRVLNGASTYVMAHPAETAPLVAEYAKMDLGAVANIHRSVYGTTMDAGLVQPFIDAAAKYGQIPRAFPAREIFWT